jgi:hypothetical protein
VHEYGYKLGKVWFNLIPPEFLHNFSTAFHKWDHATHTSPLLILTIYQPHPSLALLNLEMAIEIYARMLAQLQDMTWLNPKSQSYVCSRLLPLLQRRLGSHYLKCRPHMSNAVFVSLLAHSWMSSAGKYRSVLLLARCQPAPSYLCNSVLFINP